jgi:DNA-binding transcriptional LysR family regulator
MSDRLFALRLFARIARSGSFSRAAREIGISQPSASRIAAELEQDVGVPLLVRTTRGLTLTDAGAEYLARIEPLLAALDEADHAARGTGELRGSLRVATSVGFGMREVIPRLAPFVQRHPALHIDLLMSDQRANLVAEGVDLALRWGELPDSSAIARSLGTSPRLLAAAPAYLARAGLPETPESLGNHEVIISPLGVGLSWWTFEQDGRTVSVRVQGRLTTSVNQAAVAAAVAGLGILSIGLWNCRAELASGELVQVLPDWHLKPIELHAVFAAGRAAKPAARAFADYLASVLQE